MTNCGTKIVSNQSFKFFLLNWLLLSICGTAYSTAQSPKAIQKSPYRIQVIDQQSGRGIPLVELRTVNGIRLISDSAGNIAMTEPDLLDRQVYFHIESHGYEFPADGFGYRGLKLKTQAGTTRVIKLRRTNLAERLYRVTGTGIYRDTKILGLKPPINVPSVNSSVLGSDSVICTPYKNKLYWFWGDTHRLSYPLGNFQVTGATSPPPSRVNPELGITLNYFENKKGFTKQMAPVEGAGPTWIFGLFVTKDRQGQDRLVAKYEKIKPVMTPYQRGLLLFDDQKQQFEKLTQFSLSDPIYPDGQAFHHDQFVYFATPFPLTRVKNDFSAIQNTANYEAYTYFKSGVQIPRNKEGQLQVDATMLDRDANLRLIAKWRKNAQPLSPRLEAKLVAQKIVQRDEALTLLQEPENPEDRNPQPTHSKTKSAPQAKNLVLASGSVAWNPYRKKWVMIAVQSWGSSLLGEIWYVEAESLEGPWHRPTKVVSHRNYSFYNPRHHPYFDQAGGREIYFEGTYTKMFSGTKVGTPRYDYNQIMYKLDLSKISSD